MKENMKKNDHNGLRAAHWMVITTFQILLLHIVENKMIPLYTSSFVSECLVRLRTRTPNTFAVTWPFKKKKKPTEAVHLSGREEHRGALAALITLSALEF